MEQFIIDSSDHVFCVSRKFAGYLAETTGLKDEGVTVVPTLTNARLFFYSPTLRRRMRESLGISGRVVFIYSGSLAPYQMAFETVQLFKKILKEAPNAFFLYLTSEPENVKRLFEGVSDKDYRLLSASFSEVNAYLNAADAGLLLRENNIVNQVAAPVKIGEYLCSGLPLYISSGIGDMDDHFKSFKLGELICTDGEGDIKGAIGRLLKLDRGEIEQAGKKLYAYESYVPAILKCYENAIAGGVR